MWHRIDFSNQVKRCEFDPDCESLIEEDEVEDALENPVDDAPQLGDAPPYDE